MLIKKRQALRVKLLKEIYDAYFDPEKSKSVQLACFEASLADSDEKSKENSHEKALAYQYLMEKNLIKIVRTGGSNPCYQITADGIDYIEALQLEDQIV